MVAKGCELIDALERQWRDALCAKDMDRLRALIHPRFVLIGTVEARWRLKYLGRPIDDCVLLTDVWVFDEGRWRAIRRHSTPAPAGECPDLKGE